MVIKKRTKSSRQRGGTTHGWGSMKKHRGKGNKGGKGKAGTGKRGDAKKPAIWKKTYFGKFGFTSLKNKKKAINLDDMQNKIEKWLADKKISKEGEKFIIDLPEVGYDKLLSRGDVMFQLQIKVPAVSEKAIAKVKEKKGEIITK